LQQQLRVGLKATTQCDRDFLDIVVNLVETGRLPRRLVDTTFLWARDRAARKSRLRALRPMIYFKPALVLRAKRIGVKLPANCPARTSAAMPVFRSRALQEAPVFRILVDSADLPESCRIAAVSHQSFGVG